MRKIAILGAAVAFLGAAGAANAETISGLVRSFNASAQTIVLDDGRTLSLQPGLNTDGLEPGTLVTLNVEEISGVEMVTGLNVN